MKPHASLPLLFALALPLFAQEPSAPTSPVKPPPVIISLSFPGGTIADFVAQVRSKEAKVNIVIAEAAKGARLPAIELRGAGLDQALEAACVVAEGDHDIRVKDFRGAGEPVYSVLATPRQGVARGPATTIGPARESANTQVYSLNHLTADAPEIGFPAAVILSSIEAATAAGGEAVTVRYHKESGLLILRGGPQLHVAHQVIESLGKDVERRRVEVARKTAAAAANKPVELERK